MFTKNKFFLLFLQKVRNYQKPIWAGFTIVATIVGFRNDIKQYINDIFPSKKYSTFEAFIFEEGTGIGIDNVSYYVHGLDILEYTKNNGKIYFKYEGSNDTSFVFDLKKEGYITRNSIMIKNLKSRTLAKEN